VEPKGDLPAAKEDQQRVSGGGTPDQDSLVSFCYNVRPGRPAPRQKDGDAWSLDVDVTQEAQRGRLSGRPDRFGDLGEQHYGSLGGEGRQVEHVETMKKAEQRNAKGVGSQIRCSAGAPARVLRASVTTADTFSSIPQIACRRMIA
jgi:hypothetical protein